MTDLIQTMQLYIKLLENECSRMSAFCHIHGKDPAMEDIIKGKQLRTKIKELTNDMPLLQKGNS